MEIRKLKPFIIDAIKFNMIMSIIPVVALYTTTDISWKVGILVYFIFFATLTILSIFIKFFFFLFDKTRDSNSDK